MVSTRAMIAATKKIRGTRYLEDQVILVKKKITKYNRGRPKKQQSNIQLQIHQVEYISNNKILQRIMVHFLISAQVKLINKAGKKSQKQGSKHIEIQQINKNGNKKLKERLTMMNKKTFDVFFLRPQENKRSFKLENDKLIDDTKYEKCKLNELLNKDWKSSKFVELINLIFKELSHEFIQVFQNIVLFYLEQKYPYPYKQKSKITSKLIQYIMDNENNEMDYLLFWNTLKTITNFYYVQSMEIKLDERISEIKGEEISKTKKANRRPQIEMDQDYLAKIESQSPIEYFISELVNEFELLYQEILEDEKNYES